MIAKAMDTLVDGVFCLKTFRTLSYYANRPRHKSLEQSMGIGFVLLNSQVNNSYLCVFYLYVANNLKSGLI